MLDNIRSVCFFVSAIMFIALEIAGYLHVMPYEEATFWLVVFFFNCYLNQEK